MLKFGDEKNIASTEGPMAPDARMRVSFGITSGKTCGDCIHYSVSRFSIGRESHQCGIYQRTGKCNTWNPESLACGKFEDCQS
jgi:hypothetical protein